MENAQVFGLTNQLKRLRSRKRELRRILLDRTEELQDTNRAINEAKGQIEHLTRPKKKRSVKKPVEKPVEEKPIVFSGPSFPSKDENPKPKIGPPVITSGYAATVKPEEKEEPKKKSTKKETENG